MCGRVYTDLFLPAYRASQALESLATRCPEEAGPFVVGVVAACLEYMKYDPNYVDDGEDEEEGMDVDVDEDDDDDGVGDDRDYSDDDDVSWKVRRAAVKTLTSLIVTRPDLLSEFYHRVAPALVARFREREENVRLDILTAFTSLLERTPSAVRAGLWVDASGAFAAPATATAASPEYEGARCW